MAFYPWKTFKSFYLLPESVEGRTDLSAGAKLVYAVLCRMARGKGEAFPSRSTLGEKIDVEWRQIHRYLDELESTGLVISSENPGKSNLYSVSKTHLSRGVASLIPEEIMNEPKLSHGAKILYGRLLRFAGKKKAATVSQERLATSIGVSIQSIRRYVKELKKIRLLNVWKTQDNRIPASFFFKDPSKDFSAKLETKKARLRQKLIDKYPASSHIN